MPGQPAHQDLLTSRSSDDTAADAVDSADRAGSVGYSGSPGGLASSGAIEDNLSVLSELSEDGGIDGPGSFTGSFAPRIGRAGTAPGPFTVLLYPLLRTGGAGTQNRMEAALNLMNSLLGAGLLAMPRAFANTGLLTGLALMGLMAFANRYTLLLMLRMSEMLLGESSYPEIGRRMFDQHGLLAVLVAYMLFTGGILTAYLVILTDIFRQLPLLAVLPHFLLVWLAVLCCLPGALLRSLWHAALFSAACMMTLFVMIAALMAACASVAMSAGPIDDAVLAKPSVEWFRGDPASLLSGISLFAMQFSIQAGGIEILGHLRPDDMVEGTRESRLANAEGITMVSFSTASALSAMVGIPAYLCFGDAVNGNILVSLHAAGSRHLLTIVRCAYGILVPCSFAFVVVPCRFAALDALALRARDHTGEAVPKEKFRQVTGGILAACGIAAWFLQDLAQVLQLVGAWATMALAFVLPCAFIVEIRRRQEGRAVLSSANGLPLGLIALGLAVAVLSTVVYILGLAKSHAPGGVSGHRAMVHDLGSVRTAR